MPTQGEAALARVLDAINAARASYYATRPGFPFRTWNDIPVVSGTELAREIAKHPPFGRLALRDEQPMRAALATAVVPQPVPMCWTQSDLDADARHGAHALSRAGLRARGRSSDCLDGGLVTPGTLAISDALDCLDALALPVGPLLNDAALTRAREVWSIVQPTVLITTLDTFTFLQQAAVTDVTYVVLLTPNESSALAAPAQANVFRIVSLPIVSTFLAGECATHDGFHVGNDVHVEVLDGRLVVSSLQRCHAVARLDTGLTATVRHDPCRCGESSARLVVTA